MKIIKTILKVVAILNMIRLGFFFIWLFGNFGFLMALLTAIAVGGMIWEFAIKDRSIWGIILWIVGTFIVWWILYGFFGLGYTITQALV